ncbi:MAG: three-Cys-motif partner protein TcmP [Caulobacterales bacterium]|nr:three-Cys-motif partner protein TcmP [Caulobacterales bacterium]MCA0371703.1 three-Cys-motif partner protein TcmP [Pseudomonadota bacterium]
MQRKSLKLGIHSKDKVLLYITYLKILMNIMGRNPFIKQIEIFDLFAGMGKDSYGNKGSALRAAEEIDSISKDQPSLKGRFQLKLNEINKSNHESLKQHLLKFSDFTEIENQDANIYVSNLNIKKDNFNFFFLDPFGISELTFSSLSKILKLHKSEIMFFVPISFVKRFKDSERFTSFLLQLGINTDDLNTKQSALLYSKKIAEALPKISRKKYCFFRNFKNLENSNQYCLFFLTDNILGAERFNEVNVKFKTNSELPDFTLLGGGNNKFESELRALNREFSNLEAYEIGVMCGLWGSEIKKHMERLIKDGKLLATKLDSSGGNIISLYVNYDNFKKQNMKISFEFRN